MTTLPLYWHLSSVIKKDRLDASVKLVGALEQFQAHFVPKPPLDLTEDGGSDDAKAEDISKPDELELLNVQDVSYAIRRLIRGLASPRESSRLGFAVALTELLSRINTVTCSQILALLHNASQTSGSMTGQEERDFLFARLFGLMSVIRSGLIVRQRPLPTSTNAPCSLESFQALVNDLIDLGEKKSWLRESCWWTLALSVDVVQPSHVPWKDEAIDMLVDRTFSSSKSWTPEKVALALKLRNMYPNKDWHKLFTPTFKNSDILDTCNLGNLGRILKESAVEDDEESQPAKSNSGFWKPQLHFVWDIIFDILLTPETAKSMTGSFQMFFLIVVDETLFASVSSSERKYWGFQVFRKALHRLPSSELPLLFTKNFMRSWINHLSQPDRYLHKIAREIASELQSVLAKDSTAGFSLVLQLTGANGSRQFDRVTRTKTVDTILASMDKKGIESYIDYLLEQISYGEEADIPNTSVVNARRTWVVEQLAGLLRNGAIPKDDGWVLLIVNVLVTHGLFVVIKKSGQSTNRALHALPEPPFSDELRKTCRTKLFACLADLISKPLRGKDGSDTKVVKTIAVASDGELWISKVVNAILKLEKDHIHVRSLFNIDQNERNLRKSALEVMHKIKKIPDSEREVAQGAELLIGAMILMRYSSEEEVGDTDDTFERCADAISDMFASGKQGRDSSTKVPLDVHSEGTAVDVLVDVIIGLLENSTAYTRAVANRTFTMLTSVISESALDLILTQLERRKPGDLVDDEEEEEEEDMQELPEDQGSSSGETDEDEEEIDDRNEMLSERPKESKVARVNKGDVAIESSDESSEEELMDDDQMMQIDEQLASVFRSRAEEKKSKKNSGAQREATHFKIRVLDLIDIFIKKESTSKLVVQIVSPLVEVIAGASSDEQQLSDKAICIIRSRLGRAKEIPLGYDNEHVVETLQSLHVRARKAHSARIVATISQCSLYLSKLLFDSKEEAVLRVYRESIVDFATRKSSSLHPSLILDFIRSYPTRAWALRATLLEMPGKAVNGYRQCQAFHFLHTLLNQSRSLGLREPEILRFVPALYEAMHYTISDACVAEKPTLSTANVKELLKECIHAIRHTKRVLTASAELSRACRPNLWEDLSKKLATSEHFKDSTSLQDLCRHLSLSNRPTHNLNDKDEHDAQLASVLSKRKMKDDGQTSPRKAKRKKVKATKSNQLD